MPDTPEAAEFEALFAPMLSRAYSLAVHLTGNKDDAQDLVQEAALRAFGAFGTFVRGTNFKAWFLRILVNLHLNRCRKSGREAATVPLEDDGDLFLYQQSRQYGLLAAGQDPAAQLMSRFDADTVAAALAALPSEFRVVATLSLVEGLSYEEISGVLECPVGTVRSRLHRARKLLQKALWGLALERGLVNSAKPAK